MKIFLCFFLITSILGCSSLSHQPPGYTNGNYTYILNFDSSNETMRIRSVYIESQDSIYVTSLKHIDFIPFGSLNSGSAKIEFLASGDLHKCLNKEPDIASKIDSLISEEFKSIVSETDFSIFFIANENFLIESTSKMKNDSSLEIAVHTKFFGECDSELFESAVNRAFNTVIHESFHIYVRKLGLNLGVYDEEVMASRIEFCNKNLRRDNLIFWIDPSAQIRSLEDERYSISLKAYYAFQNELLETYLDVYKNEEKSEKEKGTEFLDRVCSSAVQFF